MMAFDVSRFESDCFRVSVRTFHVPRVRPMSLCTFVEAEFVQRVSYGFGNQML